MLSFVHLYTFLYGVSYVCLFLLIALAGFDRLVKATKGYKLRTSPEMTTTMKNNPDKADTNIGVNYSRLEINVQSTLVISNSLISNNRLSRSDNLVPVLTQRSTNSQ